MAVAIVVGDVHVAAAVLYAVADLSAESSARKTVVNADVLALGVGYGKVGEAVLVEIAGGDRVAVEIADDLLARIVRDLRETSVPSLSITYVLSKLPSAVATSGSPSWSKSSMTSSLPLDG